MWDPAVANATNAVINLVDAVCVHYRGLRSAGASHHDALHVLSGVSELDPQTTTSLRKHLTGLLSVKSVAQYEGRLLDAPDAERALAHMDRAFGALEERARDLGWTP